MKRPNREEQREIVRQMKITHQILAEMKAAQEQGLPFEFEQSETFREERRKKELDKQAPPTSAE